MKPTQFESIHGWFDSAGMAAYDQAVARAQDGDILVEVGVWLGKSACYMAELVKASGKNVQFFAVDVWKVFPYERMLIKLLEEWGNPDLYEKFLENMDKAGIADYVIPIRLESTRAARVFRDSSLANVYIDASHGYEQVKSDIEAWLPKVRPGGFLTGHDFNHNEVRRAVREKFPDAQVIENLVWSTQRLTPS